MVPLPSGAGGPPGAASARDLHPHLLGLELREVELVAEVVLGELREHLPVDAVLPERLHHVVEVEGHEERAHLPDVPACRRAFRDGRELGGGLLPGLELGPLRLQGLALLVGLTPGPLQGVLFVPEHLLGREPPELQAQAHGAPVDEHPRVALVDGGLQARLPAEVQPRHALERVALPGDDGAQLQGAEGLGRHRREAADRHRRPEDQVRAAKLVGVLALELAPGEQALRRGVAGRVVQAHRLVGAKLRLQQAALLGGLLGVPPQLDLRRLLLRAELPEQLALADAGPVDQHPGLPGAREVLPALLCVEADPGVAFDAEGRPVDDLPAAQATERMRGRGGLPADRHRGDHDLEVHGAPGGRAAREALLLQVPRPGCRGAIGPRVSQRQGARELALLDGQLLLDGTVQGHTEGYLLLHFERSFLQSDFLSVQS
mmetsp:Transcript_24285/g.68195  ORF Transcript_24285/g.68195 Transcript_24285/m.68195 type:complete len:432 (+) Transcript_24285:67-1362(+)